MRPASDSRNESPLALSTFFTLQPRRDTIAGFNLMILTESTLVIQLTPRFQLTHRPRAMMACDLRANGAMLSRIQDSKSQGRRTIAIGRHHPSKPSEYCAVQAMTWNEV